METILSNSHPSTVSSLQLFTSFPERKLIWRSFLPDVVQLRLNHMNLPARNCFLTLRNDPIKFSGTEDLNPGFLALFLGSCFTTIKRPEVSPVGLMKLRLKKNLV